MNKPLSVSQRLELMEKRVEYFEEVNRFTLDALDMACSLGNFQPNINKLDDPSAILSDSCSRIERLIPFRSLAYYLVDEDNSDFVLFNCQPEADRSAITVEVNSLILNGTFGWALRENRPVVVSASNSSGQVVLQVLATNSRVRGMFIGMLPSSISEVPDVSFALLTIILLSTANAIESFELYKIISDINKDLEGKIKERTSQLEYQALHDPLTGLANRALIFDRLDHELRTLTRRAKQMAFLLIDLDRFKEVNDTLGHYTGDQLLVEFGRRLQRLIRTTDTIARLGGDEFALFLPEISERKDGVALAQRILKSLEEPFTIDGQCIHVDASVGVVLVPWHGRDKETIMRRADVAMYAAKRRKTGFALFDSEYEEGHAASLTLMGELRKGIENQELFLHYQPKIELATGRVCGVEALLRWRNPKRGLVPPGEFIPLAEQGGLIKPLTMRALEIALEQESIWMSSGISLPVAVNLSALNLQDPELPAYIVGILDAYGVPANFLELEITESAIMTMPARGLEVVQELDRMGINLSIDDFGTGYSSLVYLRSLPVRIIKIDRSFVVNMDTNEKDAKIVHAIVDLGHNLGMKVVAEGVERQDVYRALATMKCDMAQGYLISRPVPADLLSDWLDTGIGVGSTYLTEQAVSMSVL